MTPPASTTPPLPTQTNDFPLLDGSDHPGQASSGYLHDLLPTPTSGAYLGPDQGSPLPGGEGFPGSGPEEVPLLPPRGPPIHRWAPFPTNNRVVCLFCIWNVCLAIILVVLWVLSHSRQGLFAVNLQRADVLTPWHFVPTVIATINALFFGAMGTTLLFCQPYILLQREGGVDAREALTLDYSGSFFLVAIRAIRRRHWVVFFISIAVLLSTTFGPLSAPLFLPQDVLTDESTTFNYSNILGRSGSINATSSFIRALLLSSAAGTYGEVSLPPLISKEWAIAPIDTLIDPPSLSRYSSSMLNVTIPGWYGIQSNPACEYGQLVNSSVDGLNLILTFADKNGDCFFQTPPFPNFWPFGYVNAAITCGNNASSIPPAQGGSLVFGRFTPLKFLQNDTTAVVVIYCQPTASVMSLDPTLDMRTSALISVDNIQPMSAEQQQVYDPTHFANSSLGSLAWNGFVINPDINSNVPSQLIDYVNEWINLTISVHVGTTWLNKTTKLSDGTVTDLPDAYSNETRAYYLNSLTNFYQTYLTLLAAGSYFANAPPSVKTAYISGLQTRLFVSTPICWSLIVVLLLSTTLTLVANYLQPNIALPVGTSPHMLITAFKLGQSPDFVNLGDLRMLGMAELCQVLDRQYIKLEEGVLRVWRRHLEADSVELGTISSAL